MRRTVPAAPTGSQPMNILYRAAQSRIGWIDGEIVALQTERRELATACQGFGQGNAATFTTQSQSGTAGGNSPTVIRHRKRKPMSEAARAKLSASATARALRKKQASMTANAGGGTTGPPGTTKAGKQPKTLQATA